MRIAVVQARAATGDVAGNVKNHLRLAERATAEGAGLVVFPELSITGYEPKLAEALATGEDEVRLEPLQRLSDSRRCMLAIGVPTWGERKPRISLVLFRPGQPHLVYSKQYLHADEEPWFEPGPRVPGIVDASPKVGLAICYEISIPAHAEATFLAGAGIYVASVAKTAKGVQAAAERLSAIARQFGAPVLMANCVGTCDGVYCAGGSAAWSRRGERLAQLDDASEGLLAFDTGTEAAIAAGV
jgi:predicted amidohydrolase